MADNNLDLIKEHLTNSEGRGTGLDDASIASDPLWNLTLQLMMEKDFNRGIQSNIKTGPDGHQLIIRDARGMDENDFQEDVGQYDYAVLLLSYLKAYRKVCEIRGITPELLENDDQYAMIMFALDEIRNQTTEESAMYAFRQGVEMVTTALSMATGEDKEKLQKELDLAKNWVAMEQEPMSVATITTIEGHSFIQLDEPRYQLTDELIAEYEQCNQNEEGEYAGPIWFMHLSALEKDLVLAYKDQIIEGRVIPSQLRGSLPGIKNSYEQTTAVVDDVDGEINVLNQNFHCATVVFLDKKRGSRDPQERQEAEDEMQRVTALSMAQQHAIVSADHPDTDVRSNMTTLNSEVGDRILGKVAKVKGILPGHKAMPFVGDDQPAVLVTRSAAAATEGTSSSNICMNDFRKLYDNNYDGNHAVLQGALKIFKGIYGIDPSAKWVRLPEFDKNHHPIDSTLHDQLTVLFNKIKHCHKLMGKSTVLSLDPENRGLDIVQLSSEICFLNNQIVDIIGDQYNSDENQVQHLAQWFGCASGENRTGYAEFHIATTAANDYLIGQQGRAPVREIRDHMARAGHVSRMTGFQGSTMGTEGIRAKSKATAPKTYSKKTQKHLISKAASAKTLRDVRPKNPKKAYRFGTFKHYQEDQPIVFMSERGGLMTQDTYIKLKSLTEHASENVLVHVNDPEQEEHFSLNSRSTEQHLSVYDRKIVATSDYFSEAAELVSAESDITYVQISHWDNDVDCLAAAAKSIVERGLVVDIVPGNTDAKNSVPTLAELMDKLEPDVAQQLQQNLKQHHDNLPEHLQTAMDASSGIRP